MTNKTLLTVAMFISLAIMCVGIELEKASLTIFGGVPFVSLVMFGFPLVFVDKNEK